MFDVSPNILKIYEVKIEGQSILLGCQLVSNRVGIITNEEFLIGWVNFVDEGEIEPFPALLGEGLIIRFDIHSLYYYTTSPKYEIIDLILSHIV